MSVIPKKGVRLDLYEGSTFDRTLTFYTDAAATMLKNLTGYTAALQVKKDFASDAILSITNGALTEGPSVKAIVVGDAAGTLRIYVGSTLMAALNADQFTAEPQDDGSTRYVGVWDLEVANAAGERFRYIQGQAVFSQEVTT